MTIIISIIAIVISLYVGFKRRITDTKESYLYLNDRLTRCKTIEELCFTGSVRGFYFIEETTTSILGKERTDNYIKFVFNGSKKDMKIKL